MRRIGCAVVALVASLALVPSTAGAAYTGHSQTTTTQCTGGSVIISDANALFGQQREAQAWNVVGHETTCEAFLTP